MNGQTARHAAGTIIIQRLEVAAYTIPTDQPESDGTLAWDSTTLVAVHAQAGGRTGMGYTYADGAAARLIQSKLVPLVIGQDALAVPRVWETLRHSTRNLGRPGLASMAIAAVDTALWDLKARLLDLPLVDLFGSLRERVPVYGSGGFTSYSLDRLQQQVGGWAAQGIGRVKIKLARHPAEDLERVRAAREAIGPEAQLMVDANGGYQRKEALARAEEFAELGVTWFEEPVSSDDLEGLRLLRDRGPGGLEIAAGEYGYDLVYFRRMLEAGAVDVLQVDATRCAGFTELLRVAALCEAHGLPLSAHTAPALHAHVGCAAPRLRDIEYFHDHVRIERMLLDGALEPVAGQLCPDRSRPGMGLELKQADAQRYRQPV